MSQDNVEIVTRRMPLAKIIGTLRLKVHGNELMVEVTEDAAH